MQWINKLLFWYTANRPARLITINDQPYLERYFVGRWRGVTFYLHRYVSSDNERFLHNHPWTWSRSIVLSGGYDEEVVTDLAIESQSGCLTMDRRINWWNRIDGNHFHRIANAAPGTWTLFFHSERAQLIRGCMTFEKGWGFLEPALLPDGRRVVAYKPHPSAHTTWWLRATIGRYIGREPL